MWMQVGSRAFFTGANQRIKKHDDEPKKQHSYLDGLRKLRLANINSLSQVCLPNSHFGHQIGMPNDIEINELERNQNCDCVILSNPTMNELMDTIKAKSTPNLHHLIVVGNMGGTQKLLMTQVKAKEDDGKSSDERKMNETIVHRAFSADDITQLTDFGCSGEGLLLRIRSEGTLVPLPGIDSSLSKQMAILNPINNHKSCTESAVSLINSELEGRFMNISSDSSIGDYDVNDNNKYMGLIPCKCCLCLGHAFNLNNGIDYQVKQAKQIVAEAVEAAKEMKWRLNKTQSQFHLIPLKSFMAESLSLGTTLYIISLAHLLLVITCLRGIF